MNAGMDLLEERTKEAEQIVLSYLPVSDAYDRELTGAMRYSVTAGGKRLRPVLMMSFYRLFWGTETIVHPFMAAMEMLHTYSLVHDDLPAIDNDDYRRGRLTTHKKFGEAAAILAGDGLLHQAYETIILDMCKRSDAQKLLMLEALDIFGSKTGIRGMLGGQAADVMHTGQTVSDGLLAYIYEKKTGALIEGSMMIGAKLAGADQESLACIETVGRKIGLAFQIMDDILDRTGNEAVLGKPVLSDEKNHKKTYVTAYGMEQSQKDVIQYTKDASDLLAQIGKNGQERVFLQELFLYLTNRVK